MQLAEEEEPAVEEVTSAATAVMAEIIMERVQVVVTLDLLTVVLAELMLHMEQVALEEELLVVLLE
jgi:hypothetical protein